VDKIDTTTETQEENQPTKPLGELLKSYRERAAMDYDQAANTLCLTVTTLQALENEQFDLLPEAPYIRGYLRSYAKLANVSSAEAIARYEEIRGGTSTAANLQYNFAPTSSVNNIIKPVISPILLRFGLLAVVILSLAVISMLPDVREWSTGIWTEFSEKTVATEAQSTDPQNPKDVHLKIPVAQNANSDETTVATTTPSSPTTSSVPDNNTHTSSSSVATTASNHSPQATLGSMNGEINRQNQTETNEQTTDIKSTQINNNKATSQETSTTTAPIETATVDTNNTSTIGTSDTPSETENPPALNSDNSSNTSNNAVAQNTTVTTENNNTPPTATTTAGDTANTPVTDDTNPQVNTEDTTTAESETTDAEKQTGEVSIKLVFTKEVWMRVDSNKKKVFSGLKKDGDTEEFKASKPLSFKVGNAPGVEIYIDGQRYDQTPHTRGAVSRFKIEDTP